MSGSMSSARRAFRAAALVLGLLSAGLVQAAVPGISGTSFGLTAGAGYGSQPDGASIYSWGYGCAPAAGAPAFVPYTPPAVGCPLWQIPGPTLVVTEGQLITVTLTNNLPVAAGNTSISFPGMRVTAAAPASQPTTCSNPTNPVQQGLLTLEAAPGCAVQYTMTVSNPGTYAYYSGTQPELQIEMGLYGAMIVLPLTVPSTCTALGGRLGGVTDYRLAPSAYDHPQTCYDREYLFQFAEMSSPVHQQVDAAVNGPGACNVAPCPALNVGIEPYRPNYFLINGRSMPDDMDPSYAPNYPNQPYNGNPHMHPNETMLMRIIGQGRWQHPFHFHANHARVIARDGQLLLAANDSVSPPRLAGPLLFTTPTVPGQTQDQLFTWTGKGLNWDVYGHTPTAAAIAAGAATGATPAGNAYGDSAPCYPDVNGYYTIASIPPAPAGASNYGEYCADHNKAIPATPPDPQIVTNGLWYGGTPYLGLSDTHQNHGYNSTPLPPGFASQNPGAGYAYMWHSHNEREITTNDVFPGGMMMMLIIDAPVSAIDETL